MFKIAKLENVNEEKVSIKFIDYESKNNKKNSSDSFKTLAFDVTGLINKEEYEFSFILNCKPEELLKIKESEIISLKNYLFESETFFTFNGITYMEPLYDINMCRWLENKFVISITFYSESHNVDSDIYSGMIEFEFNLDDYL